MNHKAMKDKLEVVEVNYYDPFEQWCLGLQ